MKKILLLTIIVTMLTITGCGKKETIVGKWESEQLSGYIYTFNEDKTCVYDIPNKKMKCTYTVEGDNLSILFEGDTAPFNTKYRIEKAVLIIKDSIGNDVRYKAK